MDTKMEGGKAVALASTGNTSRISTRSTRKKKTALISPKKFIEFVHSKHSSKSFESGFVEIFKEMHLESPTFTNFFNPVHKDKNANKNIWLIDATRVIVPDVDYIHASYVDGSRPNQYILSQAPFNATLQKDFYKMIKHVKAEAVIITDGSEEASTFIINKKEMEKISAKVSTEKTTDDVTTMHVNLPGIKDLKVVRMCRWDTKCPSDSDFNDMHEKVRKFIGWNQKNPIVFVCKDGATKSGVSLLLDMETERLKEKGKVKLSDSLKFIRTYRCNTFDTLENFEFACNVIVEMCKRNKK